MSTIPKIKQLSADSVAILNAIRNTGTANYRDYVPQAENSDSSIREIGNIIMQYPSLQNEFLSTLVNRIGKVILTSKMYTNPLAVFKKGVVDFGETVEEIFVNLAKPHSYDVSTSTQKVFARETPDVRSAFHPLNYKKFYKSTIQQKDLRQAFLSVNGITELITKIIESMYAGASYDEFLVMKYIIAKNILNGRLHPVTVPEVSDTNAKTIVSKIKSVSNSYEFVNSNFNASGVDTSTPKNDQYIIVNSEFDAVMNVEVLASAFNMSKADFTGHRVLIDSFGELDTKRLNTLLADDTSYTEISQSELNALKTIPAVLVDKNWFMIFDNLYEFTEQYNGEGLYWNYWYHNWKTFSVSPFANATVFVPNTPSVTSVTINPSAITVSKGQTVQLSANVETENFAPQTVDWRSDTEGVTVDIFGNVTVSSECAESSAVITATSTYDNGKFGSCNITIQ